MRMVLEQILQSSVAQFEFSCTNLAHGHGVQQSVGLMFLFNVYKSFFNVCHVFTFLNVFYFCLNVFYLCF